MKTRNFGDVLRTRLEANPELKERVMEAKYEADHDCRDYRNRQSIVWVLLFAAIAFALMPVVLCFAGPHEQLSILAARVKYGIALRGQMPDEPPNLQLNLRTTVNAVPEPDDNPAPTSQSPSVHDADTEGNATNPPPPQPEAGSEMRLELFKADVVAGASPQEMDHAHKCPRCSHVWTHNHKTAGPTSHNCPKCGTYQNVIDHWVPARGPCQYEVTVYSSPTCGPCESAKKRDGNGNAAVLLMWQESAPPAGITERYPTYAWNDANSTLRYVQGVHSLDKLQAIIERNDPPMCPQASYAARGNGGAMRTGGKIGKLISGYDSFIGADAEASVVVARSGLQNLSVTKLQKGEPWTNKMVCGTFGHVSASTTSKRLPMGLQQIGFTYKTLENNQFDIDVDTFRAILPTAEPPRSGIYGGEAYGVIDPISIGWSIFSIGRAIYQMLNPEVTVGLPGTVSATTKRNGDNLVITFNDDVPTIHVSAWWRWDLPVQRIDISRTNVHVQFKPQRYLIKIESRDFAVNDN